MSKKDFFKKYLNLFHYFYKDYIGTLNNKKIIIILFKQGVDIIFIYSYLIIISE